MNKITKHIISPIVGAIVYTIVYMLTVLLLILFLRSGLKPYSYNDIFELLIYRIPVILATCASLYAIKKTAPKLYVIHTIITFTLLIIAYYDSQFRFQHYYDNYKFVIIDFVILSIGLVIAIIDTIVTVIANKKHNTLHEQDAYS